MSARLSNHVTGWLVVGLFLAIFGRESPAQSPGKFQMVIASDTQYPWSPNLDAEIKESDSQTKSISETLNKNHIQSMNTLASQLGTVKGVIINGDLTAFGHDWQYDKYKEMYAGLKLTIYPGIGNHDYANNVGDNFEERNNTRMVEYIKDTVHKLNPISFDLNEQGYYKFPSLVTEYEGSLAYSWEIGNVHFVQLNNYPIYTRTWSAFDSSRARRYTVKIQSALNWLDADLAAARNAGRAIVLNYHDSNQHWKEKNGDGKSPYYSDAEMKEFSDDFKRILTSYNVGAVFCGHYHTQWGKSDPPSPPMPDYAGVPLFYCGSASQSRYLLATFDGGQMTVEVVDSTNGGTARTPSGTYTLPTQKPSTPVVTKKDGFVTFFNDGGFAARFYLSYSLEGSTKNESTGSMALGNKKTYNIPGNATNVEVKGEVLGFSWKQVFKQTFTGPPDTTYKVYGVSIAPKWTAEH